MADTVSSADIATLKVDHGTDPAAAALQRFHGNSAVGEAVAKVSIPTHNPYNLQVCQTCLIQLRLRASLCRIDVRYELLDNPTTSCGEVVLDLPPGNFSMLASLFANREESPDYNFPC